jgi:tetratricopeptide (TPR) repeat protein
MPGFAPARMLACMMFVARGTMDRAEQEAEVGVRAQRQHQADRTPLPAVGHHWLRGLLHAAKGDLDRAIASFDEEISASSSGHVYGREFAVNAYASSGFVRLIQKDTAAAARAFARAIAEAPGHPKATIGMLAVASAQKDHDAIERWRGAADTAIEELTSGERGVEAALAAAGKQIVEGDIDQAVEGLDRLLTSAPAGPAGWIIPIDPMLAAIREHPSKTALFAKLAARAA